MNETENLFIETQRRLVDEDAKKEAQKEIDWLERSFWGTTRNGNYKRKRGNLMIVVYKGSDGLWGNLIKDNSDDESKAQFGRAKFYRLEDCFKDAWINYKNNC